MYCCFQGYGRPGEIPDHHQTILQTSAGITSLTGTLTHTFTHAALWSHEAAPQRRPELQNLPLPLPEMDFKQLRWQRLQWFSPSWSDFLICLGSAFAPLSVPPGNLPGVRYNQWTLLPAHHEVGQWCGWGESGDLSKHMADAALVSSGCSRFHSNIWRCVVISAAGASLSSCSSIWSLSWWSSLIPCFLLISR